MAAADVSEASAAIAGVILAVSSVGVASLLVYVVQRAYKWVSQVVGVPMPSGDFLADQAEASERWEIGQGIEDDLHRGEGGFEGGPTIK